MREMGDDVTVCALVAPCECNREDFTRRWKSGCFDCVIAVDGGRAVLDELGCMPDLTLGDFDSLGYVPSDGEIERHPSHKDKSDLELAFDRVSEQGFSDVVVYGALGGRLDHTVANLQMCARFAEEGLTVLLIGSDCAVRILVGPTTYDLPKVAQGTVSVFAGTREALGVAETGLEYPLDKATLSNRTSLGLSNELTGVPASISVEEGTLFVFHPLD